MCWEDYKACIDFTLTIFFLFWILDSPQTGQPACEAEPSATKFWDAQTQWKDPSPTVWICVTECVLFNNLICSLDNATVQYGTEI